MSMEKLARVLALMMVAGSVWAVDINTATLSELESVKGLGPAKAKAIVAYREKNGNFKSLDELDNVKGFGKSSVDKLRGDLSVSTPKVSGKSDAGGHKN
jgi:competence protein ComEA